MSSEFTYEPAVLVLSDGRAFHGRSVGASGAAFGAIVFNTAQNGSFEAITDAANAGALLAFTTPHIGNTGVGNPDSKPSVAAVIMRDPSRLASHWDSAGEFEPYLIENGVIAISHIDTRALIRHAGANYREDGDTPVLAGLFAGDEARKPVTELVETVKAQAADISSNTTTANEETK